MALDRDDRTLLGLVIAPLATVPILSAAFAASLIDEVRVTELLPGVWHMSFFFALFGLPVAYAAEALLVLALRLAGGSPRTVSGAATMMLGTGAGLLVFGLLGLDSLGSWLRFAGTGALMGGGASTLFVLVRGRESTSRGAS